MQMHNEYCFPYKKKKHEKKTTNTFIKTEKRKENHLLENRAIEISFWFIPISRSIAKI